MRRTALSALLILCVLQAVSCATDKSGITDETFNRIYDKYANKLILDGAVTYTVKNGDSLSKISEEKYGNQFYYPVIMLASRSLAVDPDKIQPGMQLTIIDLEKNLADRNAKAAVKGVISDCVPIERERNGENSAQMMREHAIKLLAK